MPLGPPEGPLQPAEAHAWSALEMLLENATFGFGFMDLELRYVRVNPVLAKINGVPPAAHVGRTLGEILPELAATLEPIARKVLRTGEAVRDLEVLGETPAMPGAQRSWNVCCYPVRHGGEPAEGVGWVVIETTRARQAELALAGAEAMFRSLVEQSLAGIYVIQDERLGYVNPKMAEIFGYTPEELTSGVPLGDLVAEEDRETVMGNVRRRVAGEVHSVHYSFQGLRKDGSRLDVEVHGTRTIFGGRPAVIGILLDTTEQRRMEHLLRQTQKMEAVGRLAGGVAHDFNNLLTVIAGYSELMLSRLEPGSELRRDAEEILKASRRASSLTRQLLAFSRKQVLQPRVVDLNEVATSMDRMLRRLIGEDVTLETSLAAGLWPVKADLGQLEQVILNLALNARDAMPGGGRLSLSTANVDLHAGQPELRIEVPPGRYATLAVTDTGVGMDAEVLSHLFEPFFTTKGPGHGTGLGTATVYGIVEQSGGTLQVTSAPGRGTTVRVFLPRCEAAPVPRPGEPREPGPGGRETILLVEDEDMVRALAQRVLEAGGYRVLCAADGVRALELLHAHPEPVHLLITDVVMPVMGGPELAERVRAERAGTRVMFISGYSDQSAMYLGALGPGRVYLQKPFAPEALAREVRMVLDSGP